MLKRITIMMVGLLVTASSLFGQNYFFSPEGKEILEVSTSKLLVKFQDGTDFETQKEILEKQRHIQTLTEDMLLPAPKVSLVELKDINSPDEIYNLMKDLKSIPNIEYTGHFLLHPDGTLHGIQNLVLVGLRSPKDLLSLKQMVKEYGARVTAQNEFDPLMYHITVDAQSNSNALELANELAESGLFQYVEPDFLRLMKPFNTNDPFRNNQWSLNNDGSNTASWGGTSGMDMSVYGAWSTTTGSSSISVAILDEGVDLDHPDLIANMLGGYDATGQGSGGDVSGNDAHGTACAGIVAGVGNNSTGVVGVAYGCKIVPVRIAYSNSGNWVTSNSWISNALNWSWQTAQADVLSNSWGGGSSSSAINSAISGSITNGRSGLGAPVLFAAGNDNSSVSYPATNNNTISVIAMSMCGERKSPTSCDNETFWGSNYGTNGDVAAPGVKIYATDISGSAGYSSGDYTATFNGTSSACPNAAGVMALILSANANLTESQARDILEGNCDKVGGYSYNSGVSGQPNGTWSNDLGYGLVNAQAAVLAAAPSAPNDAGISSINNPNGNTCVGSSSPQVSLNNYGSNTLSSVNISYQLDGVAVNTYNWTGSLASGASTTVTLPSISYSSGSHTLTVSTSNPNGNADSNTANDGSNASFYYGNNALTLSIVTDNYATETTWDFRDAAGNVVASGGPYATANTSYTENLCIADGCYDFTIYDSYGDGICCSYGSGSYTLTDNNTGNILASGGEFTTQEATNFCLDNAPPPVPGCTDPSAHNYDSNATEDDGSCETCSDGSQNGDETGIDCGGALCGSCPVPGCTDASAHNYNSNATVDDGSCETCSDGSQNGDETGIDCGGALCAPCTSGCTDNELTLTILTDNYAAETTWDVRDAAGNVLASGGPYATAGTTYTEDLCIPDGCFDLTIYDSFGDGICCAYGTGAYKLTNASENILASGGEFTSQETTNFCLNAIGSSSTIADNDPKDQDTATQELEESPNSQLANLLDNTIEWQIFPNPATDVLNVRVQLLEGNNASVSVMDITGKLITLQGVEGNQKLEIQTNHLEPGVYLIQLLSDNKRFTKKFIVNQ